MNSLGQTDLQFCNALHISHIDHHQSRCNKKVLRAAKVRACHVHTNSHVSHVIQSRDEPSIQSKWRKRKNGFFFLLKKHMFSLSAASWVQKGIGQEVGRTTGRAWIQDPAKAKRLQEPEVAGAGLGYLGRQTATRKDSKISWGYL